MPEHENWYKNPYRWLDDEDLGPDEKRRAYTFFRDMLVNRETEFQALFNLFLKARWYINTGMKALTTRQEQAVEYAIEAMRMGKNEARYVAMKLGVHLSNAYRLLERADYKAKIANFSRIVESISRESATISWRPKPELIQRKMASMSRQCACSGTQGCKGKTRGDYALCWSCMQKHGLRGEWEDNGVAWILPEAQRIQTQHRRDAINELYEDFHAGRIDAPVMTVIENEALPMAA